MERIAAQDPQVISLAGGLPNPALFPRRALSRAFAEALHDPNCPALQYGWPEGSARLREFIAKSLQARGAAVQPENVLITSGAQQAINLALSAAVRAGDLIGVERESYPAALEAIRSAKGELVGLEDAVRAYYVMPGISNPRGLPLDATVRHALLHRSRVQKAIIIEDDAYTDTAFDGRPSRPLLADAPERVFHVGTFSKTLAPGLRVGWLVSPPRFHKELLDAKQTMDLQANSLAQTILESYLRTGEYTRHLKRIRRDYAARARKLALHVRRHLPQFRFRAPAGGFSLWLESDLRGDEEALYEAALRCGVTFDRGAPFRISPVSTLSFRLSYSAVGEGEMEAGVSRLASALESAT
ncbi:MAG TPA: PLP-dependent aminotransferase family protein [Polyangiaceae bacterium]|nr:PLP-dependent aminotransferase family protein [Polyangiaceae bacterium]